MGPLASQSSNTESKTPISSPNLASSTVEKPEIVNQKRLSSLAHHVPWVVLALGLILSAVVTNLARQQTERDTRLRLDVITERIRSDTSEQLRPYVFLVKAAVGYFGASRSTASPARFRQFLTTIELSTDYPNLASLDFIKRVVINESSASQRSSLTPSPFRLTFDRPNEGYLVTSSLSPPTTPPPTSPLYTPANADILRQAMEEACDSGAPILSRRLKLAIHPPLRHAYLGFVLLAPIYDSSPPPSTVQDRRQTLRGFIAASLRADDLQRAIGAPTALSQVVFQIYTGTQAAPSSLLLASPNFPTTSQAFQKTETISALGFPLTLIYATLPQFQGDFGHIRSHQIAIIGLVFSLLLFGLTSTQSQARAANERALRYERERASYLQDLNQTKTKFFSNLSHELRTPLNGILGMTDLLWDTPLSDQQKDYLTSVGTCGRTLLDLISDVLDVSKIEAGKLELKRAPFWLQQPFISALEVVRGQARGKNLALALEWDERLPTYVQGDLVRLRQVLVNLLSNAVKFTTDGSITLKVKLLGRSKLSVEVTDTGIGISPENQTKLFLPFSQISSPEGMEDVKGTGLGLVICKEILHLMGATITLSSKLGEGSTFRFLLPLHPLKAPASSTPSPTSTHLAPPARLRLLVADDNPINLRVLLMQLQKLGHSADGVDNGAKALAATQKKPYDLILMDCQMPVMDGLKATQAIKSSHLHPPVIIALTAHAQPEHERECLEVGMDDFLAKPVEFTCLAALIEKWQVRLSSPPTVDQDPS